MTARTIVLGPDATEMLLDQVRRLKTHLPFAAFPTGGGSYYVEVDTDPLRTGWVCRGATEEECHERAEIWFEPVLAEVDYDD